MTETQAGAPPGQRSGPQNPTPRGRQIAGHNSVNTTATVTHPHDNFRALVERAAALVAEIGDQAERDRESWNAGYREAMGFCRAMFDHGVDVGYAQAEEDMARAWRPVAESVRNIPRLMELQARRYPGYTPERLAELRAAARERFGLPSRPREGA